MRRFRESAHSFFASVSAAWLGAYKRLTVNVEEPAAEGETVAEGAAPAAAAEGAASESPLSTPAS